ncbi:hypothetical protein C2845_PM01G15790 [Panicum miliaceum]|uniref:Uncharacterized protein n=1 Tax=Panicum miliaceum TaxID=4540 RepID=A0A3L6TJR6_PANMI|nr:hypothetical protein C2845_PM01G15790 [Panicum miliaceum]
MLQEEEEIHDDEGDDLQAIYDAMLQEEEEIYDGSIGEVTGEAEPSSLEPPTPNIATEPTGEDGPPAMSPP